MVLSFLLACTHVAAPVTDDVIVDTGAGSSTLQGDLFAEPPALSGPPEDSGPAQADTGFDPVDTGLDPVDSADPELAWYLDLDGDGFGAGGPLWDVVAPEGFVGRPGDCDDRDDRVHPDQVSFFREARADGSWDYDCDGDEALGWSWLGLCSDGCLLASEGWDAGAIPACGEAEAWVAGCEGAGPDEHGGECREISGETRVQACR